eukprot:7973597-Pyramimonas_sp.AAC.1
MAADETRLKELIAEACQPSGAIHTAVKEAIQAAAVDGCVKMCAESVAQKAIGDSLSDGGAVFTAIASEADRLADMSFPYRKQLRGLSAPQWANTWA